MANDKKLWTGVSKVVSPLGGLPGSFSEISDPRNYNYNAQARVMVTDDLLRELKHMLHRIEAVERDSKMWWEELGSVRAFYNWMIHAYPETIAQYKALKELEAACRTDSPEVQLNAQKWGEAQINR